MNDIDFLCFQRWIYNRLCKNLCSLHDFDEAKVQIKKALKIAKQFGNFGAVAEDELEYGNIFAYFWPTKHSQALGWMRQKYFKIKDKSTYFQVYELAYYILSELLCENTLNLYPKIEKLRSLRKQTFYTRNFWLTMFMPITCWLDMLRTQKKFHCELRCYHY